ncbi:prepilin peptidase [Schnuerera sp. xch1]|uniref:prepilin peptidase n=1 Tax=Schnuerera sp. xch1 TaxID=2874283 RepID=UPI001CBE016D|nr:prepilin peptidase [Schnuerera sp. xch1]MBZ2175619.1 prepilin peptidase [Schnuerera sp. xch1]
MFFSFLLMAASYTDIKKREIPDTICVLIALIGLLRFSLVNLFGIVIAIPFLLGAVLKENSIGGGDIKLTASAGMVLGFWKGIYGLIIGLSLLILFYLRFILISKIEKKQVARNFPMPLAPFLGIGFMIIYFIN